MAAHRSSTLGDYNFTAGTHNAIVGNQNFIGGNHNQIESTNSVLFGVYNNILASGPINAHNALIGGRENNMLGNVSESFIAAGRGNTINGYACGLLVSGGYNTAMGNFNLSSGSYNLIEGNNNLVFGQNNQVLGWGALAGGYYNEAPSFTETVLGYAATKYSASSTNNFVQTDRLLVVGNGFDTFNRHNALTILKSGNTGVGTDVPTSTLEVEGSFATSIKNYQVAGTNDPDGTAVIWVYTSGTGTITLPAASSCANRRYIVVNATGGSLTISQYLHVTVSGLQPSSVMTNGNRFELVSDGNDWIRLN